MSDIIKKIWINSILFGFAFILVSYVYLYFYTLINPFDSLYSFFYLFNRSLGISSVIMIGLCFLILPLSKLLDYFKTKIVYRKYFGLTGFYLALLHTIISLSIYPIGIFLNQRLIPFLFGSLGLIILVIDAVVSNNEAYQRLGGFWWKMILRLAYLSYILIAAHIGYGQRAIIYKYFETGGIPPTGLLLLIFITLVLVARFTLMLYDLKKTDTENHL